MTNLSPTRRLTAASLALVIGLASAAHGQAPTAPTPYPQLDAARAAEVRAALQAMKRDPRGPYQRIVWICADGTRVGPRDGNCQGRGGGRQHAEFSAAALGLHQLGFHPGTIFAALPYEEFVDAERAHDRLRELVLEAYLIDSDDGWVLRRAQYYRGARQIEDEEGRGREHLQRLLGEAQWRRSHPLLATLLVAAVPHGQVGVPGARIRQLAEEMAAVDPRLQDLRIKIHSHPGPGDLEAIQGYRREHANSIDPALDRLLTDLAAELTALYTTSLDARRWEALRDTFADLPEMQERMRVTAESLRDGAGARTHLRELAATLRLARDLLNADGIPGGVALALIDTIHYGGN